VKEKVLETMPYNPYVVPSNPFTYKKLSDDVDYLYLGTFYGGYAHRADTFYNATLPKMKAKKLIIDVRNNTGGGQRTYEQLLKHLKSSENTAEEIAIIQNKNCVSACEHFISWFNKNGMATTYGENTSGMLAYGYGNRSSIMKKLACTGTTLEITETKYPQYKDIEFIGLEPKVFLDRKTDWIQQVQNVLDK
jgi:C-terminal processing protease CtpA/Prc